MPTKPRKGKPVGRAVRAWGIRQIGSRLHVKTYPSRKSAQQAISVRWIPTRYEVVPVLITEARRGRKRG